MWKKITRLAWEGLNAWVQDCAPPLRVPAYTSVKASFAYWFHRKSYYPDILHLKTSFSFRKTFEQSFHLLERNQFGEYCRDGPEGSENYWNFFSCFLLITFKVCCKVHKMYKNSGLGLPEAKKVSVENHWHNCTQRLVKINIKNHT